MIKIATMMKRMMLKSTKAFCSGFYVSRGMALVLVAGMMLLLTGASDQKSRFNDLGHKMICSCSCGQILLECNHVGCTRSEGMRNELTAGLERGDNDDLVLQGFVQKYGATVLAAPMLTRFDAVAWVVPLVALVAGLILLMVMVRLWRDRPIAANPVRGVAGGVAVNIPSTEVDEFRQQAREETKL